MNSNDKLIESFQAINKTLGRYLAREINDSLLLLRIENIVKEALAVPLRNCDVGTPDEQQQRHHAWCRKHGIDGDLEANCFNPDMCCELCTLRWAQMTYEKGSNDEN